MQLTMGEARKNEGSLCVDSAAACFEKPFGILRDLLFGI